MLRVIREGKKMASITLKCGDCRDLNNWPKEPISILIGDPPFKPKTQVYRQIRETTEHKLKEIKTEHGSDWDKMMRSVFIQYSLNHSKSGYVFLKLDDFSARELYMRGSRYDDGTDMITYSYSIIWDKARIGLGRKFRKRHEVIEVYLPDDAKSTYWFQDKKKQLSAWHGNSKGLAFESILRIPNFNQGVLGVKITNHINQTPFMVWVPFLRYCAMPNSLIFDPWMGTGSIGLAVQYVNRRFSKNLSYWGIEIDKEYFKIAENALQPNTVLNQFLYSSENHTFNEVL